MVETAPATAPRSTPEGRRFIGHRKVRLGDVALSGRLRLDALTRYTQDVSDDDTTEAGLSMDSAWVVRRTALTVSRSARIGEELTFNTYCSGLGKRWAERRLDIDGGWGACYEVTTLWICVDPVRGRPAKLSDQFIALYGPAAQGRVVSARLVHPKQPPGESTIWEWPLRAVDFDTLGHVNNAAYWAVAEQAIGAEGVAEPFEGCIEYGAGLAPSDRVTVHEAAVGPTRMLWLVTDDGTAASSISISAVG